jgi:Protein of unknown function (DUF3486)
MKKKKKLYPGSFPIRKDEETDGILNRAQKTRAEKGPSPSSSPLKGEGKNGEGAEGQPTRVPIDPIPLHAGKIRRLPPDLKEELDKMLSAGRLHSCRQLAKWLGDNGYEISHAAIHKYGRKFERKLQAVRMATEQARIVCEQFDGDDEQMRSALMRLVQTNLFEVLVAVKETEKGSAAEEGATIAPVNLTALARSVSGLARAETEHRKWAERARAGVAEAGKKVEEAREKGLSKDAAEQIKSILMEI